MPGHAQQVFRRITLLSVSPAKRAADDASAALLCAT